MRQFVDPKNKAMLDRAVAATEAYSINFETLKKGLKEGKSVKELPFKKVKINQPFFSLSVR